MPVKETFKHFFKKNPTKSELKELRKMALNEIKEWKEFIKLIDNKLK